MFQKDPAVLIAHQGVGNDSLAALKGKPIMVGGDTRVGWWLFLKAKFGYTDDQIRTYNFNIAPFLADKNAVQQGYLTSEPFLIEKAGGEAQRVPDRRCRLCRAMPRCIETSQKLVDGKARPRAALRRCQHRGLVQLYLRRPAPANALIKKDNPEENDALLAYAIAKMKETASSTAATARGSASAP